jgi:uncharacterized protein YdhG (YjbR/CyaY superfamily)
VTGRNEPPAEVVDYIEALHGPQRRLFDRLQDLIIDELPDAEVVFSYQIPMYEVGRRRVGLSARRHDGVTLTTTSPDHIAAFKRSHPGFKTNKASIQFDVDDDVPDDAVRDVIRLATRD